MNQIEINNISFGYTSEKVINNLNLAVKKGELVAIIGENGSGKSTLLKLILGEYKVNSGYIKLLDTNIEKMKSFKEIGYVPQIQSISQISFPITVSELVVLNKYEDFGFFKIPKSTHKKEVKEILEKMGLSAYAKTPVNELSGGLRQRAMISRAMINSPKLLILDEPTAGVDQESKENFLKLISEMRKSNDITIVIVSHEIDLIKENIEIDNVYKMVEGSLVNVRI